MSSASTHDSSAAIPLGALMAGWVENLWDLLESGEMSAGRPGGYDSIAAGDPPLQQLGSPERHLAARRYCRRLARLRIAPRPRRLVAQPEAAEGRGIDLRSSRKPPSPRSTCRRKPSPRDAASPLPCWRPSPDRRASQSPSSIARRLPDHDRTGGPAVKCRSPHVPTDAPSRRLRAGERESLTLTEARWADGGRREVTAAGCANHPEEETGRCRQRPAHTERMRW